MRDHSATVSATMEDHVFYNIMADGTVKQVNPFTGTEVWAVPGRGSKPITNEIPSGAKKIENHTPEDYCSFCEARLLEVPPEKARLVARDGKYETLMYLHPEQYNETTPTLRRVPNLFEIVTLDYWRKNYGFKMTEAQKRWKEQYLSSALGVKHVTDVLTFKLKMAGKNEEEIRKIHGFDKLAMADAFFGGGHELVIAKRHYVHGAEYDTQLYSSGEMTQEEHYWYTRFTIDSMKSIFETNRYARYISVFQNWLRPAGASFDHLHKQLVALDEWGSSIERQVRMLRDDPNVYNEYGANFASYHNLVFAENDYAIAFVGIGHRFPTIEIYSRSSGGRPFEHTDEEIRGMSNLVHAIHAAMGNQISCNEEWYYTPIDAIYKMPWHVLIKWRINVPAGFEGGTSIFINPITPLDLRDKLVPRLYKLRDEGRINTFRVAEECRLFPNPLKYYMK